MKAFFRVLVGDKMPKPGMMQPTPLLIFDEI